MKRRILFLNACLVVLFYNTIAVAQLGGLISDVVGSAENIASDAVGTAEDIAGRAVDTAEDIAYDVDGYPIVHREYFYPEEEIGLFPEEMEIVTEEPIVERTYEIE